VQFEKGIKSTETKKKVSESAKEITTQRKKYSEVVE
jgi:hypothetical protein